MSDTPENIPPTGPDPVPPSQRYRDLYGPPPNPPQIVYPRLNPNHQPDETIHTAARAVAYVILTCIVAVVVTATFGFVRWVL